MVTDGLPVDRQDLLNFAIAHPIIKMEKNYLSLPAGELIQRLLKFFLLLELYFIFNDNLFPAKLREIALIQFP